MNVVQPYSLASRLAVATMLAPGIYAATQAADAARLRSIRQAAFGILDTEYVDLPANVDVEYLRSLQNRSGQTMADVIQELDDRMAAFNAGTDPLMAQFQAAPTDEVFVEDPTSGVIEWQRHTQYVPVRPGLVEGVSGHNLAIEPWDKSLGWTEEGLEEASTRTLTRQVDGLLQGLRLRHRREFFRRLFGTHEQKVAKDSTATSPGAIGSGTGLNRWQGATFPDGTPVPNNYSHYFRVSSDGSSLRPAVKLAKTFLGMWQGEGTWELLGNVAGIAAVTGVTADPAIGFLGFQGGPAPLIQPGPNEPRAQVDPAIHVGVLDGDIAVRKPIRDFGGAYFTIYRSNGNFAEGNPLVLRYDALRGRGVFLRSRGDYPLAQAILLQWFGYNWNNRTNGALFEVNPTPGGYVGPVIS